MHVPSSKAFRRCQNDIGEESDECDVASAIAWVDVLYTYAGQWDWRNAPDPFKAAIICSASRACSSPWGWEWPNSENGCECWCPLFPWSCPFLCPGVSTSSFLSVEYGRFCTILTKGNRGQCRGRERVQFGTPALTELMPIHVRDGIKSCEFAPFEKGCICVRTRVTHGCTGVMDGKVRIF